MLLHFCFPFCFQCFILYSIYTDLDLTLTWGKDSLRVAEKAIYSCSAAAAVFWKMNRIRLCLITFHITWWTAVEKKHKMNPARQPLDTLLLTGAFLPPPPPACVFLIRIYAWGGSARRGSSQHKGRHFSHSVSEWEVQFMSTHDLEDMGCGTSSSTKDRKSEKGECQWEVGGARFLEWPRESEPASPSPLSQGSHSLLQPPPCACAQGAVTPAEGWMLAERGKLPLGRCGFEFRMYHKVLSKKELMFDLISAENVQYKNVNFKPSGRE